MHLINIILYVVVLARVLFIFVEYMQVRVDAPRGEHVIKTFSLCYRKHCKKFTD